MISAGYKSAYQQGYSDAMRDFRKKPKTDVLDKIRAEIKHHSEHFINDDGDDCLAVYEDDVLEIINKYKADRSEEV